MSEVATAGPAVTAGTAGRERWAVRLQRSGAYAVLALVVLVASLRFDTFATTDNARNILLQSSFLAIIALGMTFVIISGGIDLSVGSVFALGGVLSAYGFQEAGTIGALVLPLLVCGAIGLLNGLLIAYGRLAPFIVTLASLLGARGLLLVITDEGALTRPIDPDSAWVGLAQGRFLGVGWPVWIALALFAAGAVLLNRSAFGQSVFAIGGSEDAARLMGLPVARRKVLLYLSSGLLAGFAGALAAGYAASGVTIVGVGLELDAIAAVVIGGTLLTGGAGTIGGTLCGVLLLRVIQNIINQIGTLNSSYQSVVSGAFLVGVVVLQRVLSRDS